MTGLLLTLSLLVGAPAADSAEAGAQQVAALERWHQQMFAEVAQSVVFIAGKDGIGSGFFVSDNGWILTNAHVVEGSDTFDVVLNDGRRFEGQVVQRGKDDIDFALVKIPIRGARPLRLDNEPLAVGTWLGSVGHGLGGMWTFNTGMVSNVYPVGGKRSVFQTDIPLNPGNSGGPLVNRHGRVVGVVTAGVQGANNVNFGLRVELALASLDKLGDHCDCWVIETDAKLPLFLDGVMVGSGPRVVIPALEGTHDLSVVRQGQRIERRVSESDRRIEIR